MVNQNDNHIDPCFHDLMDRMASGDYSHLQVFMSRKNDDHRLPQEFLYVDPVSFGRVWVNKVWLSDNNIIINLRESSTGTMKEISVDVNARPGFLMVKWDDIVKMVMSERTSSTSNDQLLDFDY